MTRLIRLALLSSLALLVSSLTLVTPPTAHAAVDMVLRGPTPVGFFDNGVFKQGKARAFEGFGVENQPHFTGTGGATVPANTTYTFLANGNVIGTSGNGRLTMGAAEVGKTITIELSATAYGYNEFRKTLTTGVVVDAATFSTPNTQIYDPYSGRTATAQVDGVWAHNEVVTMTTTWFLSGTQVGTGSTYAVPSDAKGKILSATTRITAPGHVTQTVSASREVSYPYFDITTHPTLTGTVEVGETLTFTPTVFSPTPASVKTKWLVDPYITQNWVEGTNTFLIKPEHVGKRIYVMTVATGSGRQETAVADQTTVVPGLPFTDPNVTLAGTAKVGEPLTATLTATPAPTSGKITWYRGTTVVRETFAMTSTYTPVAADAGQQLRVAATMSRTGYDTAPAEATTAIIDALTLTPEPITVTGLVDGAPTVQHPLTPAVVPGVTGATVTFQWRLQGTDEPWTATEFTPEVSDLGKQLDVRATITKVGYHTHTTDWLALGEVAAAPFSTTLEITGNPAVGGQLTADYSATPARTAPRSSGSAATSR